MDMERNFAAPTKQISIKVSPKRIKIAIPMRKERFFGIIAIRVGDLLISGSGGYTEYISREMHGRFVVDSYGGIKKLIYVWKLQK